MTDPLVGSSPALDRLRAEINDKLSVAFFTAGHTSKVHQQIVLKQCEDYLVELFQTTVRELVPVPPQPVKEIVRKAYTDGMSEAWAIAKNSEAPNGVLRAIDARISEWASQEPEVDHRETIAALKAELANHSPSDFHRPSSTCPDGELHKLRCIRCEIPAISAVPPAPSGAPVCAACGHERARHFGGCNDAGEPECSCAGFVLVAAPAPSAPQPDKENS